MWQSESPGQSCVAQFVKNGGGGLNRLGNVGFAVRERNECRFELRRSEIDASFQHPVEPARILPGVGAFRGGIVRDRLRRKKRGQHGTHAIDGRRDMGLLRRRAQPAFQLRRAGL